MEKSKDPSFHIGIEDGRLLFYFPQRMDVMSMNSSYAYAFGALLIHGSQILDYCESEGIKATSDMLPKIGKSQATVVDLPQKFVEICESQDQEPWVVIEGMLDIFENGDKKEIAIILGLLFRHIGIQKAKSAQPPKKTH